MKILFAVLLAYSLIGNITNSTCYDVFISLINRFHNISTRFSINCAIFNYIYLFVRGSGLPFAFRHQRLRQDGMVFIYHGSLMRSRVCLPEGQLLTLPILPPIEALLCSSSGQSCPFLQLLLFIVIVSQSWINGCLLASHMRLSYNSYSKTVVQNRVSTLPTLTLSAEDIESIKMFNVGNKKLLLSHNLSFEIMTLLTECTITVDCIFCENSNAVN